MNDKTRVNWREELTKIFNQSPDLKAPQYQKLLESLLGVHAPSLSSIQKELITMRHEWEESHGPGGLDTPWHFGLMETYKIPAEAVPYILMVQNWAENNPDIFGQPHAPLTIRQVLWISRLWGIIGVPIDKRDLKKLIPSMAHYLYAWAEAYSTRQRLCELSPNIPFDTAKLDKGLREMGEPLTASRSTLIFYRGDKSFSIDTIDDNLRKQIESMKKDGEK